MMRNEYVGTNIAIIQLTKMAPTNPVFLLWIAKAFLIFNPVPVKTRSSVYSSLNNLQSYERNLNIIRVSLKIADFFKAKICHEN